MKKNLEELRLDLDTGDYGEYLVDWIGFSEGKYISDVICEIADNNTSIYYSDIMKFISENPEALADVIDEGLYNPSNNYDLYEHGQAAEYMTIERDINNHISDSLMLFALEYIEKYFKDEISDGTDYYIDDKLIERLENVISENPDKFDEITEVIDNYFTEEDEN